MYGRAWRHRRYFKAEIVRTLHRLTINFVDDIPSLQPGFCCGAVGFNIGHQSSFLRRNVKGFRQIRRDLLNTNSDIAAHNFPVLQDLVHYVFGHVDRNGEANSLIASRATRKDGGVNASHNSLSV